MKKILLWSIGIIALIALIAGGLYLYNASLPETHEDIPLRQLNDGSYELVYIDIMQEGQEGYSDSTFLKKFKIYSQGYYMVAAKNLQDGSTMVECGTANWNEDAHTMTEKAFYRDFSVVEGVDNTYKMFQHDDGFHQDIEEDPLNYVKETYLNPVNTESGLDGLWVLEGETGAGWYLMIGGDRIILASIGELETESGPSGLFGTANLTSFKAEGSAAVDWMNVDGANFPAIDLSGKTPLFMDVRPDAEPQSFSRKK